jgi:hypothetical protein
LCGHPASTGPYCPLTTRKEMRCGWQPATRHPGWTSRGIHYGTEQAKPCKAIRPWRRRCFQPTSGGGGELTQSRNRGTSRPYGGPDRASSSRSGGAQHARALQGARRPTSGLRSWRMSLTPAGWNGYGIRTGRKRGRCLSADPLHTSSGDPGGQVGRSPTMGWRPDYRQEVEVAQHAGARWDSSR